MLKCGDWERSNSYFKFENWWIQTEGFKDRIKNWWSSFRYEGSPDYILQCKLRDLKNKLKAWSKTIKGNLGLQKKNALIQLAELEEIQESRGLQDEEIASRVTLMMELEDIARKEEVAWRQRSRAVWLNHGDRNTKFFHKTANAHRRFNNIDKLKKGEVVVEDTGLIKQEIVSYYENLYTETESWRLQLDMENYPRISEEDSDLLVANFEAQEILESLTACARDKAPGPDGFSMEFFKQFWEIIKEDLIATIQFFHEHCFFEKNLNATFVALIPKKVGAMELNDVRPISLIGGVYKIIAKLLAGRLKKVIHSLIGRQQMAFVKGRQVMDAALIANECIDSRQRSRIPGLVCKLDIQKAYDHLNWDFLLKTMEKMGFGVR